MSKPVYLATTEPHCGKSLASLGIVEKVLCKTHRVAVFRPVVNETYPGQRDKNIDLLLSHFKLDLSYEDTFAFTSDEANSLLAEERYTDFLNRIIQKFKVLEENYDFVLCIGSDFSSTGGGLNVKMDAEIASSLNCLVVILSNAHNKTPQEILAQTHLAVAEFRSKGCPVVSLLINRADPAKIDELKNWLKQEAGDRDLVFSIIPLDPLLASPTIKEIMNHLNAEVLYGHEKLHRIAHSFMVIAMQMHNYLRRLKHKALLLTPGDRGDIILSALLAHQSGSYPPIAGIVLTTGERPAASVKKLIDGLPQVIPILLVETETHETATHLNTIRSYITADNPHKIEASLRLFTENVDMHAIEGRYVRLQPRGIPPRMFLYNLIKKAKAWKQHIVFPEGTEKRILRATERLIAQNMMDVSLLGDPAEIERLINRWGVNLKMDQVSIIDPCRSPKLEEYARTLYELRKHKGMTPEAAHDQIQDISCYGTMMVYKGDADGMVSGANHTTAHTITPAFQFVKTKPGCSLVSSVFFMCLEDRVLVYGDCAINPRPTAEQLAEIAIASADTAHTFGIEPKVAMLSYSTGYSGHGEEVERVRKATKLAQEKRPDLLIDGPIQYDAAIDVGVAKSKMPESQVAGHATVFIFPDLNSGNTAYKAVQRATGAIAIGPVLQGLNGPVNDLSRGCTVEDIINTAAITAIQAQALKAERSSTSTKPLN